MTKQMRHFGFLPVHLFEPVAEDRGIDAVAANGARHDRTVGQRRRLGMLEAKQRDGAATECPGRFRPDRVWNL